MRYQIISEGFKNNPKKSFKKFQKVDNMIEYDPLYIYISRFVITH